LSVNLVNTDLSRDLREKDYTRDLRDNDLSNGLRHISTTSKEAPKKRDNPVGGLTNKPMHIPP
jgi:hypothetical protein